VAAQIIHQLEHRLIDEIGVRPLEARMTRAVAPVGDGSGELVGRHAGMRGGQELKQPFFSGGSQRVHVAFEYRFVRLLVLPIRMLRRHDLDPVEHEGELKVDRLLRPQRAIVVESGDPLGRLDEIGTAFLRHACNEVDDR
jgi:hypothetical protein